MCVYHTNNIIIPTTNEDYVLGKGEICPARFNDIEQDMLDGNHKGMGEVVLASNSANYPKLKEGLIVPVKYRKEGRPIIPYEWLENFK